MMDNSFWYGERTRRALLGAGSVCFGGICGIGMSGLAQLLHRQGVRVSGVDRDLSCPIAEELRAAGIPVLGEDAPLPGDTGLFVYTAALNPAHPAVRAARARGIPMCSRADLLAGVALPYPRRIAVAGMHGKSTTVGMLARILTDVGENPTVCGGAPLEPGGAAWRAGGQSVFLCEACEYRDSFLSLSPTLSVVTNIDLDHPDWFPDLTAVKRSFSAFLAASATALVGADCPALTEIAPAECRTFGFSPDADYRGVADGDRLTVWEGQERLGTLNLRLHGDYQHQNALAAVGAARMLGVPFPRIADALAGFRGIGGRMEEVGTLRGARVFLDYAHHPTEMRAAIGAARRMGRRVLCVFQPHTYTRTRALWDAFRDALRLPDKTVLTDIYPAREPPLPGITSARLAEEAGVAYAPDFAAAGKLLTEWAQPGDVLLVMGAGSIRDLAPSLVCGEGRADTAD